MSRVEIADAELVSSAVRGDRAAFELLVDRFSGRVLGMALRMLGDRADAEDVTQEVFVTAWCGLSALTEPAAVRTWLFRVAHRQCLAVLRSRAGRRTDPAAELPDWGATPVGAGVVPRDPERSAEALAALEALWRALRGLPPAQRAVWLLAELDGLSYAEIADALGTTEESVRGRLARARHQLAATMRAWR
nr:RNA polymerase sigma factor [Saccharothrix coeruleofusca]